MDHGNMMTFNSFRRYLEGEQLSQMEFIVLLFGFVTLPSPHIPNPSSSAAVFQVQAVIMSHLNYCKGLIHYSSILVPREFYSIQ